MRFSVCVLFCAFAVSAQPPTPPVARVGPVVHHSGYLKELSAPGVKKNVYPCKVVAPMFVHVHEKGGLSSVYQYPLTASDAALVRAMPDCIDPIERDGR